MYGAQSDEALVKAALKLLDTLPAPTYFSAGRGVPRRGARQRVCGVGSDEAIDPGFPSLRASDRECGGHAGDLACTRCVPRRRRQVGTANLLPESFDVDVDVWNEPSMLIRGWPLQSGQSTARQVPRQTVERLLASPKLQRTIVVVDEAYVDFAPEPSTAPLVKTYPRLVVLHTLSKAFGLAGVRCGTAIGSPATIHYMNAVKAPYSINKMTSCLAAGPVFSPKASCCCDTLRSASAPRGSPLTVRARSFPGRELFAGALKRTTRRSRCTRSWPRAGWWSVIAATRPIYPGASA